MAANDNVKIIIKEVNQTQPRGSGTSSDIVYIPGLGYNYEMETKQVEGSSDTYLATKVYSVEDVTKLGLEDYQIEELYEPTNGGYYRKLSCNTPQLCSTIDEFVSYFGDHPYEMTCADVATSFRHNYKEKDIDKSYVYAKELINAGLTVLYENIAPDNGVSNLAIVHYTKGEDMYPLEHRSNNVFALSDNLPTDEPQTYEFMFKLPTLNISGDVQVNLEVPEVSGLSISLDSIEVVPETSPFSVDDNQIHWSSADATDFEFTSFKAHVTVSCSNSKALENEVTFRMTVTDAAQSGTVVCGSRIEYFYTQGSSKEPQGLVSALERLKDKNEYTVKYITSGGYPTFIKDATTGEYITLYKSMIDCAEYRQDAVAIIDHADNPDAPLDPAATGSVFSDLNRECAQTRNGTYGAMFTPWGRYACSTVGASSILMPASFGYLMCLATAIKTSPNWLAMAGVSRGIVPNLKSLHTKTVLSNVIAENYQPKYGDNQDAKISLNAITNIKPYGLTVWGNRTLEPVAAKGTTALNFLNTRNMISDIKKVAYSTAKQLMFEQDSDTLWLKFKSGISPLLDQLKSGFGISDYKIIKGTTKYDGSALTNGELAAVIKIYPLYAIEYFEITVVIADNDVSVQ